MQAIEFQTTIENGVIQVPEKYRSEVVGQVRVIVLAEGRPDEPYDIITELMNNPLQIPNFKPLTREEIYER